MRMMLGHPSIGLDLEKTKRFESGVSCSEGMSGVAVDSIDRTD